MQNFLIIGQVVPEIWGGTHRLRMRIYYTDSRNWREIYGCIISTFCLHILKIYFSNQKQILEIVCRIVLRLAKIVSLPNCWAFVLNTNWIFRTEWKSELDWERKWRIKVTQIPRRSRHEISSGTLFEIFIFCPKIQLWFPRKLSIFCLKKLVKMLWFWTF